MSETLIETILFSRAPIATLKSRLKSSPGFFKETGGLGDSYLAVSQNGLIIQNHQLVGIKTQALWQHVETLLAPENHHRDKHAAYRAGILLAMIIVYGDDVLLKLKAYERLLTLVDAAIQTRLKDQLLSYCASDQFLPLDSLLAVYDMLKTQKDIDAVISFECARRAHAKRLAALASARFLLGVADDTLGHELTLVSFRACEQLKAWCLRQAKTMVGADFSKPFIEAAAVLENDGSIQQLPNKITAFRQALARISGLPKAEVTELSMIHNELESLLAQVTQQAELTGVPPAIMTELQALQTAVEQALQQYYVVPFVACVEQFKGKVTSLSSELFSFLKRLEQRLDTIPTNYEALLARAETLEQAHERIARALNTHIAKQQQSDAPTIDLLNTAFGQTSLSAYVAALKSGMDELQRRAKAVTKNIQKMVEAELEAYFVLKQALSTAAANRQGMPLNSQEIQAYHTRVADSLSTLVRIRNNPQFQTYATTYLTKKYRDKPVVSDSQQLEQIAQRVVDFITQKLANYEVAIYSGLKSAQFLSGDDRLQLVLNVLRQDRQAVMTERVSHLCDGINAALDTYIQAHPANDATQTIARASVRDFYQAAKQSEVVVPSLDELSQQLHEQMVGLCHPQSTALIEMTAVASSAALADENGRPATLATGMDIYTVLKRSFFANKNNYETHGRHHQDRFASLGRMRVAFAMIDANEEQTPVARLKEITKALLEEEQATHNSHQKIGFFTWRPCRLQRLYAGLLSTIPACSAFVADQKVDPSQLERLQKKYHLLT